ncbi:MAG: 3-deoxy-7-phosphoheptulonate synthase [Firmicutes bacterium]|jgi:3-deoxy-7-phosphoheptulonate synthase|nr:3-deoxy-7-phosphoheptulonate synthase [Bacillota bacterium]
MVVVMKSKANDEAIEKVVSRIEGLGLKVQVTKGEHQTILGLIGDTKSVDESMIYDEDNVEKILKIQEPYKLANRDFHPEDTLIEIKGHTIGGGNLTVMAGPCSIESEEQIIEVAKRVKEAGANVLRGGAFKPRTSPYSFQGLGLDGLKMMKKASEVTGLPIVTEVMSTEDVEIVEEYADILQIGARNMSNFSLLKKVGRSNKPVLLKRGMSATVQELLMSAEYIMSEGNKNVILCERGIRTFETYTRNTLDLSVVTAIKELSHLPIIIDPSHATGKWKMVEPMSKASVAVGADGLMIEVHNDPQNALCDGPQSLKPEKFDSLMKNITKLHKAM